MSKSYDIISKWKITIKFNNSHHEVQAILDYPEDDINGSTKVRAYVDPLMIAKLHELKWPGFGLWSAHEAITKDTVFDDISYQKNHDNSITFDCEDHDCKWRHIITKPIIEDECVICMEANDKKHTLMCMHMCVCSKCWPSIDKCPMCRKRKII